MIVLGPVKVLVSLFINLYIFLGDRGDGATAVPVDRDHLCAVHSHPVLLTGSLSTQGTRH